MTELFRKHPVAAWIVLLLVIWVVGMVTAPAILWLMKPPAIDTNYVSMYKAILTFYGLVTPAVLAGLWKLKGL